MKEHATAEFREVPGRTLERSWTSEPDGHQIDEAVSFIIESLSEYYPYLKTKPGHEEESEELYQAGYATRELVTNGLYRGNLEAKDASQPDQVGKENGNNKPALKNRKLVVRIVLEANRYQIIVIDQGFGFDLKRTLGTRDEEHLLENHGRGLKIIKGSGFDIDARDGLRGFEVIVTKKVNES